jgi:cytidylate kinase
MNMIFWSFYPFHFNYKEDIMKRPLHKIIEEQINRWERGKIKPDPVMKNVTVITISREAGSRGREVAEKLAQNTGFDLFHNEIVESMIETSKNSRRLLETLDERGMNIVEDIVSALVNEHHLWPDEYAKLLLRILNTIAEHGNAVILGRGANCALAKVKALKVRIVAPAGIRRKYLQRTRDLSYDDAEKLMHSTDANRTAFVRRYFNSDATDPANYDLILNTGFLSVDKAVQVIQCAISNS